MTPKMIKKHLDKYVIKQDRPKEILSSIAYIHDLKIRNKLSCKNNILLLGSTGSGKSYISNKIAEVLDLPVVEVDCSRLSNEGYTGDSISSYFQHFLDNCSCEGSKHTCMSEYGILILDEFDKLSYTGSSAAAGTYKKMLQQELLRIIEGNEIKIPIDSQKLTGTADVAYFDTSNLLIIMCGAFSEGIKEKSIGFGNKIEKEETNTKDIELYGFIPELVGRIQNIVHLETLKEEDLKEIILTSLDSPLAQYQQILKLSKINVDFTDAISTISKKCIKNGTGARSIHKEFANLTNDIIFKYAGKKTKIKVKSDLTF